MNRFFSYTIASDFNMCLTFHLLDTDQHTPEKSQAGIADFKTPAFKILSVLFLTCTRKRLSWERQEHV